VAGALELAVSAIGAIEKPYAEGELIAAKVVAETAMLLFAVQPVRHLDAGIDCAAMAVTRLLVPHARSEQVLAAVCLDPGLARDHAVAHIILTRLGHPDSGMDQLLNESLSLG